MLTSSKIYDYGKDCAILTLQFINKKFVNFEGLSWKACLNKNK